MSARTMLLALLLGLSSYAVSAPNESVLAELARKSGIPEAELSRKLADCDADQSSLNFCAWRDQLVAEQGLRRALARKSEQLPACREGLNKKVEMWMRQRDAGCEKSAAEDYGDGSMKPMVRAMCAKAETVKMTRRVGRIRSCRGIR